MNCKRCRRQILSSQDLQTLTPELAAHLAECLACRQWQQQLSQIESNVPWLPVPASESKDRFQQQFLQDPSFAASAPASPLPRRQWSRRRRLITGAGGLAAAGVLIACGIFWSRSLQDQSDLTEQTSRKPSALEKKKRPPKTLAGQLLEWDLKLAAADSPRRRVETLAQVADRLHGESQALAQVARSRDLDSLAQLYGKVVRDGIVPRARKLPAGQRRHALDPIVAQLARAKQEAEELAGKAVPESAQPLRVIAAAARTGNIQLRALLEETP